MNLTGWKHELSFETDYEVADYLYTGISKGFKIIDDESVIEPYQCDNYKSIFEDEAYKCISELMTKEIQEGKYIPAKGKPRTVHALGAIRKSDSSFRPITDCKRPINKSINNYMEMTHRQFSFVTTDQVADLI